MDHMKGGNVDVQTIYRTQKGISWIAAVIWMQKLKLPFSSIWYGGWKKTLGNYDTVIVFNRNLNWNIVSYIKRKSPNTRVIAWYWDTVDNRNRMKEKYRRDCELWSFDADDCEKYHMKKNCQFYFLQDKADTEGSFTNDFMFVGKDKRRVRKLEQLENELKAMGYRTDFRVMKDKTSKGKQSDLYITQRISYAEVLKMIKQSRCLVEINKHAQSGMTVRALEALFWDRKLLTDNSRLAQMGFNSGNVFIVDNSLQHDKLADFMEKELTDNHEEREEYRFERWIERFGEGM